MDTPRIRDLIKKGHIDVIKEAMEQGVQEGCQTFDQSLFTLYRDGKIALDQALINADSMNNLRLKIKLAGLQGDEETEEIEKAPNTDVDASRKTETIRGANAFRLRRT